MAQNVDYSQMSDEELKRQYQASFGSKSPREVMASLGQGQASTPQMPQIGMPNQNPSMGDRMKAGGGNFLRTLAEMGTGVKQDNPNDMNNEILKSMVGEQAKSMYRDPLEQEKIQAEIDALKADAPRGFVKVGGKVMNDPDYVKPPTAAEQFKIDEAEKAASAQGDMIRSKAEQNLSSIAEAKKGSRFFGIAGGLPTWASSSSLPVVGDVGSLLTGNPKDYKPQGEYDERKIWENNINQLLSQKVVDLITEMKQASKTGATGFGQLTEREGAILREASTALSRDLPPEQAIHYLNEMEKINKKILGQPTGNVPPKSMYEQNQPVSTTSTGMENLSDEELKAIING